jgi:uncharacterized iron-regulated membrane protein
MPKLPRIEEQNGAQMRTFGIVHRTLGLIATLFVLLLVVTGIAINHSDAWKLDTRHVSANWLLDWYGIAPPGDINSIAAGGTWVSQLGDHLYIDAQELPGRFGALIGAVRMPDAIAIATSVSGAPSIVLATPAGEVVEVLGPEHGVPAGLRAIGAQDNQTVVEGAHGIYRTDAEFSAWTHLDVMTGTEPVAWSTASRAPDDLRARIIAVWRGTGLPLTRVLGDLHSGRIWGQVGVLVMDIIAISLVILAASGVWMWRLRCREQARKRAHIPRG